jgi:hypothetical protein
MTPGEAAQRKWWELCSGPKSHITWDLLPEVTKKAWEEIAIAAVTNYRCRCECHEVCGE